MASLPGACPTTRILAFSGAAKSGTCPAAVKAAFSLSAMISFMNPSMFPYAAMTHQPRKSQTMLTKKPLPSGISRDRPFRFS